MISVRRAHTGEFTAISKTGFAEYLLHACTLLLLSDISHQLVDMEILGHNTICNLICTADFCYWLLIISHQVVNIENILQCTDLAVEPTSHQRQLKLKIILPTLWRHYYLIVVVVPVILAVIQENKQLFNINFCHYVSILVILKLSNLS